MGPDRSVSHSASIQGHMPPRFGGGSPLVPAFFPHPKREGRFTGDNHSGMRHIEECSFVTPWLQILSHPPL